MKRIEEKYKAIALGKTIEDGVEEHIDLSVNKIKFGSHIAQICRKVG